MKIHPFAEIFPLLPEDELQELIEDIRANGLVQLDSNMDETLSPNGRISGMKCRSDKHEWTDPKDAEKCCNGYTRLLEVGMCNGQPWKRHYWRKNDDHAQRSKRARGTAHRVALAL